jgi:hypothetical protein
MSSANCNKVIAQFANNQGISIQLAAAGITKLIQDGGTNQSKKTLTVEVGGHKFDLVGLRSTVQSVEKNCTVRQFAKGCRGMISQIALINLWAGPLLKDIKRSNLNIDITPEKAVWCNEIHSDNYEDTNCPIDIREALIKREEQLRLKPRNNSAPNQKARGPRNSRGRNRKKKQVKK